MPLFFENQIRDSVGGLLYGERPRSSRPPASPTSWNRLTDCTHCIVAYCTTTKNALADTNETTADSLTHQSSRQPEAPRHVRDHSRAAASQICNICASALSLCQHRKKEIKLVLRVIYNRTVPVLYRRERGGDRSARTSLSPKIWSSSRKYQVAFVVGIDWQPPNKYITDSSDGLNVALWM
jgi:hypothetical protein